MAASCLLLSPHPTDAKVVQRCCPVNTLIMQGLCNENASLSLGIALSTLRMRSYCNQDSDLLPSEFMENADDEDSATPVPISEIERLGRMLLRLGQQYDDAVKQLKAVHCKTLPIAGLKSAIRGEGYLRGWLKTIREALDDEVVKHPPSPDVAANVKEALEAIPPDSKPTKKKP